MLYLEENEELRSEYKFVSFRVNTIVEIASLEKFMLNKYSAILYEYKEEMTLNNDIPTFECEYIFQNIDTKRLLAIRDVVKKTLNDLSFHLAANN